MPALGGDFQLHTKSICICFFYGQLDSYYSYYIIHRVILPSKSLAKQVAGIFGLNGWCREPNSSHASHENSQDGWKPDERVRLFLEISKRETFEHLVADDVDILDWPDICLTSARKFRRSFPHDSSKRDFLYHFRALHVR